MSHLQDTGVESALGSSSLANSSLNEIITQLNRGNSSWNSASPITFSFYEELPNYAVGSREYAGFEAFNTSQVELAHLALSTWSDVADITFWEVTSSSSKVTFANSSTLAEYSAAHAYMPSYGSWGGDVWVNSALDYNMTPEIGGYGFKVLVHEIGHAIGQPHPGSYNAGYTPLSYANNAAYAEDSQQYTIMSYWDESNTGADFDGYSPQTPMLHDVLAIQEKYGADISVRVGDTVYGFNSNTNSPIFDFDQNGHPVLCIWDAGGNDTLDLSGFATSSIVNLNAGAFSSAAGMVSNISIAYGATIENAVTGAGDDIIIGNEASNRVDGGTGIDAFCLDLLEKDAKAFLFTDGRIVVASEQGVDQLVNIEVVSFVDVDLSLGGAETHSLLEYAASYDDIADTFGTDVDQIYQHLVTYGIDEERSVEFSAMDYIASHQDLIDAFGADIEAGARHYIEYGRFEERETTFDSEAYLLEHSELQGVVDAGLSLAQYFIEH
ncbi:M10 family metallopeptidase [Roseibium sp. CAU 1637]|uniref:M10 family metallopeptidase n=1 Tax=Roseibium limicola TaxID=2816037 RepID=A0A939J784_9HYPH|nr:M10 family metallopeptidase [Roseibium limicola]